MTTRPCEMCCEKCGSKDVLRRFHKKGSQVINEEYDRCENRFASGQCHHYKSNRDHLDMRCRCCGYRWQVLPLAKRMTSREPA